MKSGAQIGVAVAAGYVLGRFHKMKWAMALATMAGRKRLASQGGGVLKQGTKLLQSSPELTKLTDDIKGSLMEAGKAAAIAAVGSRITSLSEGLRTRSESLRGASVAGSGSQSDDQADDEADDQADDETEDRADDETEDRADDETEDRADDETEDWADDETEDRADDETGDGERARPRRDEGRARPAGDHRKSRSSDRPSRRGAAEENVPRPRRRPAEESPGQRSKRRRETAHD